MKPIAVYSSIGTLIVTILAFYFFSQDLGDTFYEWVKSLANRTYGLTVITAICLSLFFLSILHHLNYANETITSEKEEQINELENKNSETINDLKLVIENLKLSIKHKDELARTDLITGVPNELAFELSFDKLIEDIKKNELTYTVVYLDLIGFKKLNDKYGQTSADKVMRKFAQDFLNTMRRNEFFYRYRKPQLSYSPETNLYRRYRGGDEFFVTLLADELQTLYFLRRIDDKFRKDSTKREYGNLIDKKKLLIEFNAGVTEIMNTDDLKSLTSRAEDLLIEAKSGKHKSSILWTSGDTTGDYKDLRKRFSNQT